MNVRGLATAITAAAGCAAIGLIVASCSNSSGSPVAPGTSSNLAAHVDASPTPDVSPTPTPSPTPSGTPCTPGYWKNHLDQFYAVCGSVSGWTCDSLLTALTCKGSDASCQRTAASLALDAVSGCTETN